MATKETALVMDTMTLIDANRHAIQQKQNRTLTASFINKLDFEGTHVVGMHFPHTNYIGAEGMRCHILCKIQDSDAPAAVWLDMPFKDWKYVETVVITRYEPEGEYDLKEETDE